MTTGRANLQNEDSAWEQVRADEAIQYEPLPDREPPEPPAWIQAIGEFLEMVFRPIAQALAYSWPVLKWVLLAALIAMIAYMLWRLIEPSLPVRGGQEEEPEWQPQRSEALALLEDADRLAKNGHYAAAVHLLLDRSVGQIQQARPGLVEPSSTARELARQPSLPDKARSAFHVIATGVERSLFALQDLNAEDWDKARAAYADFALEKLT